MRSDTRRIGPEYPLRNILNRVGHGKKNAFISRAITNSQGEGNIRTEGEADQPEQGTVTDVTGYRMLLAIH